MSDAEPNPNDEDLSPKELQQRLVFSLLRPTVALAALFGVSFKDLSKWLQVAYFEHLRSQGQTLKDISKSLDISERTTKRLSRELKVHFLRPEHEHNLPVRIEFMLRASSMSTARLHQVIHGATAKQIDDALQRLQDEGRIQPQVGRWTTTWGVVQSVQSLVRDSWFARIGGLNSLLDNLTDTVFGRFVQDDPWTLARTMTFHVHPDDLEAVQETFRLLVTHIAQIDERGEGHPDAVPLRLSLIHAPFDLVKSPRDDADSELP